MRTYAIGDIHGHLEKLLALHALIAADRLTTGDLLAPVVHVGDLVDRGPDSRGVVEYLRAGIAAGENWVVLKGNHDRMFLGFLSSVDHHDPRLRSDLSWLHPKLGGAATLESYGVHSPGDRPLAPVWADAVAAVPQGHREFLNTLPVFYRRGEVAFVHAGIKPGIALADQAEDDLVWIRDAFLNDRRPHEALIVHGHTVVDDATHYGNRVNIDTGAAYGGPMTAVVIEGRDVWQLTKKGRVALKPITG
jgi:serine/threonine protein phosphatase 1